MSKCQEYVRSLLCLDIEDCSKFSGHLDRDTMLLGDLSSDFDTWGANLVFDQYHFFNWD